VIATSRGLLARHDNPPASVLKPVPLVSGVSDSQERDTDGAAMINAEAEPATLAFRAGVAFQRYREGDQEQMASLIAMLTPVLWHTVRAQRLDPTSTEDVLQTAWLALVKNADAVTDPRSVLQWLIVTARREAWRVLRAQQRQSPREVTDLDFATDNEGQGGPESPEVAVIKADTQKLLWSHVQTLPPRCQQLLRVIAFADRPDYSELAVALGMPVGSIGPTRGRCLAKLRAALDTDSRWEH
jgi:RNA polymerase sigma factor (sigma-70 family)